MIIKINSNFCKNSKHQNDKTYYGDCYICLHNYYFFQGPLTYNDQGREVVVGVVSWGYGCALATHPGVYSRVTAALSWINEQMLQTC